MNEWLLELWAGSIRSFTPKKLQPACVTPLFPGSTNELAHLETCHSPAFSCFYDEVKTRSRCGEPLKKMLISDSCQKKVELCKNQTPCAPFSHVPLWFFRRHHNIEQLVLSSLHVFRVLTINSKLPFHHGTHLMIWLVSHNMIDEVQFSTWSAWKNGSKNKQYTI